jgi:hypothetical protein
MLMRRTNTSGLSRKIGAWSSLAVLGLLLMGCQSMNPSSAPSRLPQRFRAATRPSRSTTAVPTCPSTIRITIRELRLAGEAWLAPLPRHEQVSKNLERSIRLAGVKDPEQKLNCERAAQEEPQSAADLGQHRLVYALMRTRQGTLTPAANGGLDFVDEPRLDDELAGFQGVDIILPVASHSDDADKAVAAIEQIDDLLGDGQTPIDADRRPGGTRLDHDAVDIGPAAACLYSVHGITPAQHSHAEATQRRSDSVFPRDDPWGSVEQGIRPAWAHHPLD